MHFAAAVLAACVLVLVVAQFVIGSAVIGLMVAAGAVLVLLVLAVYELGAVLGVAVVTVAVLALLFAKWAWWPSRKLPGHRVRHLRWRLRLRLHPGRGHATVAELHVRWGRLAAFRHSGRTRPSMSLRERFKAGSGAWSVFIGRAHHRHGLRIPLQEHVVIMGPPREGKSGWLARVVLRYPGPVLSTSTKADVHALTSAVRSQLGPVAVFNPMGVGGVPSTFSWNPVSGCRVPSVAIRRADGFAYAVSQKGVEEASFWSSKASDYLRACFCAADLAGGDLRLVAAWALSGDASEAEHILFEAGMPQWAAQLAELRGDAQKTAQTVRMTMSRALAFLADPDLAACVLPGPGEGLGIGRFLAGRGTLYMVAESASEDAPLAPLFACLASEVHHTAALAGSRMPGGRLDPPLLMALDEVTQICPVPLPSWMADSGGKGIQVCAAVHGVAQLKARWQAHGARVVLDTAGVKIVLRGVTDPETLDMASKLAGATALADADGKGRHDIMTGDMIRQLPPSLALVIRSGLAPVIARLPMAWKDPLYKQAQRTARRAPAVAPAAQRPAIEAVPRLALPAAPAAVQAPAQAAADDVMATVPRHVQAPAEREVAFPWSAP